ncbi:MAG: ABC-ATPase domain-containing protein, partial [Arcanobacterium sp.]|nr:ABC-ATPase domain-containing protein [Arcanobacterium sp.]
AIDGRGYSSYRQIEGSYRLENHTTNLPNSSHVPHQGDSVVLSIDHAQVDPYAPPSRVRVFVPASLAQIPADVLADRLGRIAAGDFLTRTFAKAARSERNISIARPGQEILERTSVIVDSDGVEARFTVKLPAAGRRVRGREAEQLLLNQIPSIVHNSLLIGAFPQHTSEALAHAVHYLRARESLLTQMAQQRIIAFVADGAVLPRAAGDSDQPLHDGAVPWITPDHLRHTFSLPAGCETVDAPTSASDRTISGLAIPAGITVIVGGGYHGKSTLLRALERGIYPHIAGDGREWVATDPSAVAIRAEDGRSVANVDISAFINDLPSGKSTTDFTTTNASGSTSQATNVIEALESGARVLLIDEDTSATNFMIRDSLMRQLIPDEHEPITPLVDRIEALRDRHGVSTVIVAGGSSAFFAVADHVIAMDSYEPRDVTEQAHTLATALPITASDTVPQAAEALQAEGMPHTAEAPQATSAPRLAPTLESSAAALGNPHLSSTSELFDPFTSAVHHQRVITPRSLHPADKKKSAKAQGLSEIRYGHENIDLAAVSQLVDPAQTAAIAEALECIAQEADGQRTVRELVDSVLQWIDADGLDALTPRGRFSGALARPRRHEILAALNRLRIVVVR